MERKTPSPPASDEKIQQVWEEFLSGQCDDQSAEELLRWLKKNPQQLQAYRKQAALSHALEYLLAPKKSGERLVKSVQARIEGSTPGQVSSRFKARVMEDLPPRRAIQRRAGVRFSRRHRAERPSYWPYAAAIGLVVCLAAVWVTHRPTQPSVTIAPPPPPAIKPVEYPAVLTPKSGSVTVNGNSVTQETPLVVGNRVELSDRATAAVRLADGSNVDLDTTAILTVLKNENGPRLQLDHGRAVIQAAPQPPNQQLSVTTLHAKVTVIGTRYTVESFEKQSRVSVESGKVTVTSQAVSNSSASLAAGEEVVADAAGLGSVCQSAKRRVLPLDGSNVEELFDRVTVTPLKNETFGALPLQRFRYQLPVNGGGEKCGGIVWPVSLSPTETNFEIWIRPRWVQPIQRTFQLSKIVLLGQLGETEYLLGVIEVRPEDKDWIVLKGQLDRNSPLRWQMKGKPQAPPQPGLVKAIALRTEIGEMEFDHTPLLIRGR